MKNPLKNCIILLLIVFIAISCITEDLISDEVSNEIRVECSQSVFKDNTSTKEVWVNAQITNGCADRSFNFLGNCWNYNTDTLPSIKSFINKVPYEEIGKGGYRQTKDGKELMHIYPVKTGIPVTITDSKIIVRSFVIFNDNLIRYSEPLIIINPYDYAN